MQRSRRLIRLRTVGVWLILALSLGGCGESSYISGNSSTPPPITAATSAALKQTLDSYLVGTNQYYRQATGSTTPGAIIAVHLNGYQPWYYASGCAELNLANQNACLTPMAADMPFRIASVTKMFIAQTVIKLAEEGKLSLDDTVEKWLPGVLAGKNAGSGNAITIGMLLNHTSGLYSYVTTDAGLGYGTAANQQLPMNRFVMERGQKVWTASEIIGFANSFNPPVSIATPSGDKGSPYGTNPTSAPGAALKYSNTNYYLLGMIIEKATGKGVHEEVRRLITDPLQLGDTYMPAPLEKNFRGSRYVHGYTDYFNAPYTTALDYALLMFHANPLYDATLMPHAYISGDGILEDFSSTDPSFAWTTGGMVSSAKDLLTFLEYIMVTRVQSRQEAPYWIKGAPLSTDMTFQYGRGIARVSDSMFGHGGQFAGYNVAAYWVSNLDMYIVVMTNRYSYYEEDPNNIGSTIFTMPADTLYKVSLGTGSFPSDSTTGLLNTVLGVLAQDPAIAARLQGTSTGTLRFPNPGAQMR